MKKIAVLALLIVSAVAVRSQSLIDSIGDPSFILRDTISERLAEFAVSRNQSLVSQPRIKELEYEIKKTRAAWLNNFAASGNLNENNMQPQREGQNIYFPRYNFGVTIPIGSLFTKAYDTKIAKLRHEQEVYNHNSDIEMLKTAVKVRYQNYLSNRYLVALHEAVIQDEKVLLSVVESKFDVNEVTLDAYTVASRRYNDALAKKVDLLKNVNTSKLELESLLGVTLEEAMQEMNSGNN